MFIVTYEYWNPAGGKTHGIRRLRTKELATEYVGLLLDDELITDIHVSTPNPMLT